MPLVLVDFFYLLVLGTYKYVSSTRRRFMSGKILREDEFTDEIQNKVIAKFGKDSKESKYLTQDLQAASKWIMFGDDVKLERGMKLSQTVQDIVDGKKTIADSMSYQQANKSATATKKTPSSSTPKSTPTDKPIADLRSYTDQGDEADRKFVSEYLTNSLNLLRTKISPRMMKSKLNDEEYNKFIQEYKEIEKEITDAKQNFSNLSIQDILRLRESLVNKLNYGLVKKHDEVLKGRRNQWDSGASTLYPKEVSVNPDKITDVADAVASGKDINAAIAQSNKEEDKPEAEEPVKPSPKKPVDALDDFLSQDDDFDAQLGLSTAPDKKSEILREKILNIFLKENEDAPKLDFGDVQDTVYNPDEKISSTSIKPQAQSNFMWKDIKIPLHGMNQRERQHEEGAITDQLRKSFNEETKNIKKNVILQLNNPKYVEKKIREFIDLSRPNRRNAPALSLANAPYAKLVQMPVLDQYKEFIKYIVGEEYIKALRNPSVPMSYLVKKGLDQDNTTVPANMAEHIASSMAQDQLYNQVGQQFMAAKFPKNIA